jgi:DNA-binding response OmpR family regulator
MNKCVLIIDDEEDVREIAKMGLEMTANWTVLTASSGTEGLKIAGDKQPDLILLDLMMPILDGKQTLERLQAAEHTASIPVILMTAKTEASIEQQLVKLGIVGIITKPFRPLQLADRIIEVLEKKV